VTNRRSEALSADFPYVGDELHEATLVVSPVFRGRDLLKLSFMKSLATLLQFFAVGASFAVAGTRGAFGQEA